MKSSPSFKTRVALACLVGGMLLLTFRHQKFRFEANWKPKVAVEFIEDEAGLRAWAGPGAVISPSQMPEPTDDPGRVVVRRRVELHDHLQMEFWDLSLFENQGGGFRLLANMPFTWNPRHAFFYKGAWIVEELREDVYGWKRIAEVRLDRTEPLIVSATE